MGLEAVPTVAAQIPALRCLLYCAGSDAVEAVARRLAKERDLDGIDTSNIVSGGRRRQSVQAPRSYRCVPANRALSRGVRWLDLPGRAPGEDALPSLERPTPCREASEGEDSSGSEEESGSDSDGGQGQCSASRCQECGLRGFSLRLRAWIGEPWVRGLGLGMEPIHSVNHRGSVCREQLVGSGAGRAQPRCGGVCERR